MLLAAEALRDLPTADVDRRDAARPGAGRRARPDVVVVPVLRAGLGMLDAVLELVPSARVGHIGLQRDEMTAVASQYYSKLPAQARPELRADDRSDAGHRRQRGRRARPAAARPARSVIRMICIVAAPEGIALVEQHHPDVAIYTPVVDRELNAQKYIVPASATSAIGSTARSKRSTARRLTP